MGGLAAKFLAEPETKFKVVVLPDEMVVALIINVYVDAPALADTMMFSS